MPIHVLLLLVTFAAGGAAAQTSAPPAVYQPKNTGNAAAPTLLLPANAPARAIRLGDPTAAEKARLTAKPASSSAKSAINNKQRLAVGFARNLPATIGDVRLSDLAWTPVADGGVAARITVTSPGAAALRVALQLKNAPSQLVLRFTGSSTDAVFGPIAAATLAAQSPYWSPVLEGETATVEFALPAGAAVGDATLLVPMISHLVVADVALREADPPRKIGGNDGWSREGYGLPPATWVM
jgi:lysyl endopeptidase